MLLQELIQLAAQALLFFQAGFQLVGIGDVIGRAARQRQMDKAVLLCPQAAGAFFQQLPDAFRLFPSAMFRLPGPGHAACQQGEPAERCQSACPGRGRQLGPGDQVRGPLSGQKESQTGEQEHDAHAEQGEAAVCQGACQLSCLLCQAFLPDSLGGDPGPERTAMPHGSGKTFKRFLLRGRMVVDGLDKCRLALLQLFLLLPCVALLLPQAAQAFFQMPKAGGKGQRFVPVAEQALRSGKVVFLQMQGRAGTAKGFPGPLLPPLPAGEIVLFFLPVFQKALQVALLSAVQGRPAVGQGLQALQVSLMGLLGLGQRGGGFVFPLAGHLQGRRTGRQRGGLSFQFLPAEDRTVRGPDAGAIPARS